MRVLHNQVVIEPRLVDTCINIRYKLQRLIVRLSPGGVSVSALLGMSLGERGCPGSLPVPVIKCKFHACILHISPVVTVSQVAPVLADSKKSTSLQSLN